MGLFVPTLLYSLRHVNLSSHQRGCTPLAPHPLEGGGGDRRRYSIRLTFGQDEQVIDSRTVPYARTPNLILYMQVDGMFDKVGYDPAANSQVTRRTPAAGDAEQGDAPVGVGLPRIDLGTLLGKVSVLASPSTGMHNSS